MRLIARKPCRFNGEDYYIGEEIPVEAVADPIAQAEMGVLTVANIKAEDPSVIYTQEDVDQKVQEAKKDLESQIETLTKQISEKDTRIKELEQQVEELQSQVSPAASPSSDIESPGIEKVTAVKTSSKKTASK